MQRLRTCAVCGIKEFSSVEDDAYNCAICWAKCAPRCEVCKRPTDDVDNVECPRCGGAPLMCDRCAQTAPSPCCGFTPGVDKEPNPDA